MPTTSELLAAAFAHHQAGRLLEAEKLYRDILALDPNNVGAWQLLGAVACEYGRYDEAVKANERAIELRPNFPEAFNNLGMALQGRGDLTRAIECHRRALELRPNFADAHNNLGLALLRSGALDEATFFFRQALALNPDYPEAHCNLANAVKETGQSKEAIAHYQRAIALRPNYAEALNNLGSALYSLGRDDEALSSFERAIVLNPEFAEAHFNLGILHHGKGKAEAALASFRRAIEIRPAYAEAYYNLGFALAEQGQFEDALCCYGRAVELRPDHADAHWNRSHLLLLEGDFERGWPEYEWRWKTGKLPVRSFRKPRWSGESLRGKTILIHAEQGFGDTIQFVRYAPLIKNRGAAVVFECQPALLELLKTCEGIDQLIPAGEALPEYDYEIPLLSVPHVLKTSLTTIPSTVPYLTADQALVGIWRDRFQPLRGFRIGINWHGREGMREAERRDIPLEAIAKLAEIPNVRLVSLQKGRGEQQLREAAPTLSIIDFAGRDTNHGPFMDTAAMMMNVDLVVTTDTSVVHLAGALGVPVWVALPYVPDWRWLLDRSDSPWYPTVRLFRQRMRGDWDSVINEIRTALIEATGAVAR